MSSIPLPELHLAPIAAPPSPLAMYGQMMGIKNAQQEMQQRQAMAPLEQQQAQQQVQGGALNLENEQRALATKKAMDATMQQWFQGAQGAGASAQPSAAGAPAAQGAVSPSAMPAQAAGAAPAQGAAARPQPSYDDLLPIAAKNNMPSEGLQGLQSYVLGMKQKAGEIAKNDADTQSANATAMKTKIGMITDAGLSVMQLPDAQLPQGILSSAQDLYGKGVLDQNHMQQAQQLATLAMHDPAQARQQLNMQNMSMGAFAKELENQQKQTTLQQTQGKPDPNSSLYAPSAEAVAMGTAPGAAKIQQGEAQAAGAKAGAEARARQPYEMALASQRQALSQGDPQAAGQLLVNGDATLAELKSRGATPDFIQKALFAAHRLSMGGYNAQAADAQFDVAKSPANVAFFGSAKSLTDQGGTLDQLQAAGKAIPAGQLPAFNKLADWENAATGSGPIAKYASLALGVADDYSKVMGGGQGSDASRTQALNLIGASASPAQRASAVEGIRGAVGSQMNSRIGKNPVLQRMYGAGAPAQTGGGWSPSPAVPPSATAPAGATHIVPGPDGKNHYTNGQGTVDLGVAP